MDKAKEEHIRKQMVKGVNDGIKMGLMEAHKCLLMFLEEKQKLNAPEYITKHELNLFMDETIKNYVCEFNID